MQRGRFEISLRQRDVKYGLFGLAQLAINRIADHADHFDFFISHRRCFEPLAERIAPWPELLRHLLIHHGYIWGAFTIATSELAAPDQLRSDGGEEAGADGVHVGHGNFLGTLDIAWYLDRIHPQLAGKRAD